MRLRSFIYFKTSYPMPLWVRGIGNCFCLLLWLEVCKQKVACLVMHEITKGSHLPVGNSRSFQRCTWFFWIGRCNKIFYFFYFFVCGFSDHNSTCVVASLASGDASNCMTKQIFHWEGLVAARQNILKSILFKLFSIPCRNFIDHITLFHWGIK